jgi:hypothetical protein
MTGTHPPLSVEVRPDPTAPPGNLVGALAALCIARARNSLAAVRTPVWNEDKEGSKPTGAACGGRP